MSKEESWSEIKVRAEKLYNEIQDLGKQMKQLEEQTKRSKKSFKDFERKRRRFEAEFSKKTEE